MPKKKPTALPNIKPRLPLIALVILLVLAIGVSVKVMFLQRYMDNLERADTIVLTQQIIHAAEATKLVAPVDAKTGDTYFPQAKLYLPVAAPTAVLTYFYDSNNTGHELSISNKIVFSQNASRLYNAHNTTEVFAAVPRLQACQRGVEIATRQLEPNKEQTLAETVKLSNGRTLYLYTEKQCPDLGYTVGLLKNLKAY
jgi:hypothetical protein